MSERTFEEAFNLLCGDAIGSGISRKVFDCRLMPGHVVKVEEGIGSFENIAEWLFWNEVSGTKAERWFARCLHISPDGKLLIMERTMPAAKEELPTRVPVFCTDLKLSNWGFASSRTRVGAVVPRKWAVCHDYGALSSRILQHGLSTKALRKADWIEG